MGSQEQWKRSRALSFKVNLEGGQETVLSFLLIRSGVQVPLCASFEEVLFFVFPFWLFS